MVSWKDLGFQSLEGIKEDRDMSDCGMATRENWDLFQSLEGIKEDRDLCLL